ncbi:MAG: orotidine-5'-phosphate decarboxylase [Alphaproteobacteria bacterium]|nr:MAG: orotidine-5'-phosphate decarboxylase [Alphaproteobacteria bacterium]
MTRASVFVAIDTPDLARAEALGHHLADAVDGVKLGLEFFSANGPEGVRRLRQAGLPVFLDLKLHDIPNTVAGAAHAAGRLGVDILTIHAAGGTAMMQAAVKAAAAGAAEVFAPSPRVIAITVLTSLSDADVAAIGYRGTSAAALAPDLATLARNAGCAGIVCSPLEVTAIRSHWPSGLLVTPGIRPAGSDAGDQSRLATPAAAQQAGASVLVIGRPITAAASPRAAALAIRAELVASTSP